MSYNEDRDIIKDLVSRRGRDFIFQELSNKEDLVLTIISNVGIHPMPNEYIFGDCFAASEGNLDFSSIESVNNELDKITYRLKAKLFEKKWTKIYLIPFGHSVVSMTIKMTVYRALRIETIDLFYFGEGRYGYLERDSRLSLLKSTN